MFELRETGNWDIFLGPPERARAETGGADWWVLKRRELSGLARGEYNNFRIPGYPLSIFNKKIYSQNKSDTTIPKPEETKLKMMGNTAFVHGQHNTFSASRKLMIWSCECATCPEITVPGPPIESNQDNTFVWQDVKVLRRLEQYQHVSRMTYIHYTAIDTVFKSHDGCMVIQKILTHCLSVCVKFAGPCICHCPRS